MINDIERYNSSLKVMELISNLDLRCTSDFKESIENIGRRIDERSDYQFQLFNVLPYFRSSIVLVELALPDYPFDIIGSEGEIIPYRILENVSGGKSTLLLNITNLEPMGYETFFIYEKEPDRMVINSSIELDSLKFNMEDVQDFKKMRSFYGECIHIQNDAGDKSHEFEKRPEYIKERLKLEGETPFVFFQENGLESLKVDSILIRNLPVKKSFLEIKTKQIRLDDLKVNKDELSFTAKLRNISKDELSIIFQSYCQHKVTDEAGNDIRDDNKLYFKAGETKYFKSI